MAKTRLLQLPQNSQNLLEGKKKVLRVTTVYVLWQLGWICLRCRQKNRALLIAAVWKGALNAKLGSGFINYFYSASLIY